MREYFSSKFSKVFLPKRRGRKKCSVANLMDNDIQEKYERACAWRHGK